MIYHAIVVN